MGVGGGTPYHHYHSHNNSKRFQGSYRTRKTFFQCFPGAWSVFLPGFSRGDTMPAQRGLGVQSATRTHFQGHFMLSFVSFLLSRVFQG